MHLKVREGQERDFGAEMSPFSDLNSVMYVAKIIALLNYVHKCLQASGGEIGSNKHFMMKYYDFLPFVERG